MSSVFPASIRQALVSCGKLPVDALIEPVIGGNADRREQLANHWKAISASHPPIKLTVGNDLAARAAAQADFATSCPALVRPPLFFEHIGDNDVLGEEWFPGTPLSHMPEDTAGAELIRSAFDKLVNALTASVRPSTPEAREREWREWAIRLLNECQWTEDQKSHLQHDVLPALFPLLCAEPPEVRWSNGDLTTDNILIDDRGSVRLIDLEFASSTHFFAEDAVRCHTLSPLGRSRPDLFSALPLPLLPWHLYFWLRQFHFETRLNTVAYFEKVRPSRLGVIRRLAEFIIRRPLDRWSVPATSVEHHIEAASWLPSEGLTIAIDGWCHVPENGLRGIGVATAKQWVIWTPLQPRPDVAAHFRNAPHALQSGFHLKAGPVEPEDALTVCAHTADGTLLPFASLAAGDLPGRGPAIHDYPQWAKIHDPDPPPSTTTSRQLFSVLLPVYRTPLAFLEECIASVLGQYHTAWELLIVDDGSDDDALTATLHRFALKDRRIKLAPRSENGGIARATNDALRAANGDFIVLLDHDDVLRPHALSELAQALEKEPSLDAVYSDEDKITANGERIIPFLKPDFSPEFLRGVMYVGHVLCVRTTVANACGGFDPAYDGVQDYEFLLRVSEHTNRIAHVPRMLYHWRQSPGSSALHGNIKGNMDERQVAAVQAHLQRICDTRIAHALGGHRVRLTATSSPPSANVIKVSDDTQIMPALRKAALECHFEILIVQLPGCTSLDATAIAELAALAVRPGTGCVSPVLLASEDGVVLEAGRVIHTHGVTPVMRGFSAGGDGYNGSLCCNREVSTFSPLCFAIRRLLVTSHDHGSFMEFVHHLSAAGYRHVMCAGVHVKTSFSWKFSQPDKTRFGQDPYWNPHFQCSPADYRLADSPPHLPVNWHWHFDILPSATSSDGGIEFRGWCFAHHGKPITIHCTAGELQLSAIANHPRPDVEAAFLRRKISACGFNLRFRLPAGRHQIRIIAKADDDTRAELWSGFVKVASWPDLRRALSSPLPRLLAHQFPAHPAHEPRTIPQEHLARRSKRTLPALAVVTPSYNHARYLAETINSVLSQVDANIDYVIQDGASTDGSVEIIKSHANRLHAWESAQDNGQADAIAKGFAKTSGGPDDIMAWINSDDFYMFGTLTYVMDYFARHPDVDVLYGHRILVDESSQEIGRWFLPRHDPDVLRLNDFVPQETLFWRRRIWDKVGGIDTSFKFAMDWDLLLRFQEVGAKIVRVPRFLACFRIHSTQKTSAQIHSIGQAEIDRLRERTFGRRIAPDELESNPRLIRYLRKSAFIEFLWKLGLRAP